ncbi:MAG: tandem-95 repeat protein [Desulfobacteraceae bacterium]|nr:tandem-95 repeat protein [Desulfobacteraceae bacterium]
MKELKLQKGRSSILWLIWAFTMTLIIAACGGGSGEGDVNGEPESGELVCDIPIPSDPIIETISIDIWTVSETAVSFKLPDLGIGNESLEYTIEDPCYGFLSGTPPHMDYQPEAGFKGRDRVIYEITPSTDEGKKIIGVYNIDVKLAGETPQAIPQFVQVMEDTSGNITLYGFDPENDPLTYTVHPPEIGTLSGIAPELVYQPAPDHYGEDNFYFSVNDGTSESELAQVHIHILPVNDPPVASGTSQTTEEDKSLTINLAQLVSDPDSPDLTYTLSPPEHGNLAIDGAQVTYTPALNHSGSDHFSYQVSDGEYQSQAAMVNIVIQSVNDRPTCSDLSVEMAEDQVLPFTLPAIDVDNDSLTYRTTSPLYGRLTGTGPDFSYTPDPDWHGTDRFFYHVNDGTFDSDTSEVVITVAPVPDAPQVYQPHLSVKEDDTLTIILGHDIDNDSRLSAHLVRSPSFGQIRLTDSIHDYVPVCTFIPNQNNRNLSDSFDFYVTDGRHQSHGTIRIDVEEVNDPPVAQDTELILENTAPIHGYMSGYDPERDDSTTRFRILTPPRWGEVIITDPRLGGYTYTPRVMKQDFFTFVVADDEHDSNVGRVEISLLNTYFMPPMEPPARLSIEPGVRMNTLTWDELHKADHYRVYWDINPNRPMAYCSVAAISQSPFFHTNLENNRTYYYKVQAVDANGQVSNVTQEVSGVPLEREEVFELSFADYNLESCVSEKGAYYIYELTQLDCSGRGITDISGIENLTSLEMLNLDNNSIEELEPLFYLPRLRNLSLNDNRIKDISPLRWHRLITRLNLDNNMIQDLYQLPFNDPQYSQAAEYEHLTHLALARNTGLDPQPLKDFNSLIDLNLSHTGIRNLDWIYYQKFLAELRIDSNRIESLAPLSQLHELDVLSAKNNRITFLNLMTNVLDELYLGGNRILSANSIMNAVTVRLMHLDLSNNRLGGKYIGQIDRLAGISPGHIDLQGNPDISCMELQTLLDGYTGGNLVTPDDVIPGVTCETP